MRTSLRQVCIRKPVRTPRLQAQVEVGAGILRIMIKYLCLGRGLQEQVHGEQVGLGSRRLYSGYRLFLYYTGAPSHLRPL